MPKLLLKFQAAVIKEIPVEKTPLTIGRKPDNDIVVDNMAVSSHHAKIVLQGSVYTIEDLQSTNGTFINEKRIVTSALHHNDEILVGQHTLVFLHPEVAVESPPPATTPKNIDSEATVVIAPQQSPSPGTAEIPSQYPPPKTEQVGVLRVINGKTEQGEYVLAGILTYIGKSESSAIKIKGLFAPDIAALVSKRATGYLLTAIKDGYPKLNGKSVSGQVEIRDGDLIDVGGLKFLFQLKDVPPASK
jgi:pSer/pThr/pTyr-binding forkhead associated (FHA) protein